MTVAVDAVVYFRISNATVSVSNVEDYARSTRLLAATTLRNVLGTKNLSEILSERESISHIMQLSLDEATGELKNLKTLEQPPCYPSLLCLEHSITSIHSLDR